MKRKKLFIIIFALICIISICIKSCSVLRDVNRISIDEPYTYIVKEGSGVSQIADDLKSANVIKSAIMFKSKAKTGGYETKIAPGSVVIEPDMSYTQILEAMCAGNRDAMQITIPEGYELREVKELCVSKGICTAEEFDRANNNTDYDYDFIKALPTRENQLEGYLFPDTYYLTDGETIHDLINKMLEEFNSHFTKKYRERANEINMSIDQIVTLASIVERETGNPEERAKVAGVFYNRLDTDMPLQSCATVQYILKERKKILSTEDTQIASPYNTYMNNGLPVGPIASPGAACIQATLYPERTNALYFVLGKDGKHVFSKTYEEHLKAVEENE